MPTFSASLKTNSWSASNPDGLPSSDRKRLSPPRPRQRKIEYIDWYPDQILRVIDLPVEIDPEGAVVGLETGMLKFELPKAAKQAKEAAAGGLTRPCRIGLGGRRMYMKTPQTIMAVAFVILVVLLFTSPRHRAPMYDASDEVTMQGVVQDVQQFYCPISGEEGTHLMLRTENGTIQVHVAPTRFLRDNRFRFQHR